jgi:hypothetical protein
VAERLQPLDALRLSETEQLHILQELDKAANHAGVAELRASQRYRYLVRDGLVMEVEGFQLQFIVRPRNLSAGGISVLHGGFLYAGTRCTITLRDLDGESLSAEGEIVRCRCVHGRAHELNVHFDRPIEIAHFIDLQRARVVDGLETAAYSGAQVTRLARRIGELASEQAPLEELSRLLSQLTALLRPN